MSEVEKMYENANAYKNLCKCSFKNLFDYSIDYGQDVCIYAEDEIRHGCEGCELAEQSVKYYPPFTPDKQLELVKWCCKKCRRFYIYNINDIDNFAENLAKEFNHYWQDLTESEQEQIRSILEC